MLVAIKSFREQIRLPAYSRIALGYEPTYYGAARLIAKKAGLKKDKPSHCYVWCHGCRLLGPQDIRYYIRFPQLAGNVLVARQEEVEFLQAAGIDRVHAVGLPINYAGLSRAHRQEGSLLVMPPHATKHSAISDSVAEYANYIQSIKHHFAKVVCCMSRECIKTAQMHKLFLKHKIPVICGAAIDDANSLPRMRQIFETYDFVTTNTFGSHLAYGMAFGAKVSVSGPMLYRKAADLAKEPFIIDNPDLGTDDFIRSQRVKLMNKFASLLVAPWESKEYSEWGNELIGAKNTQSPRQVAILLGLKGA